MPKVIINSRESLLSGGSHICLGVNDWGVKI